MFSPTLQRFVDQAPVCVMIRLAMERVLDADGLDELFRRTAVRQYERELLFSSLAGLMMQVVCGSRRSVHDAYQHSPEPLAVSLTSVYNKLDGIEPEVCAALVDHSAAAVQDLIRRLRQDRPSPLPGYAVRIVDGKHLDASEHRLQELRTTHAAALPGQALAVLDPAARLIEQVLPCENAHAQERSLIEPLLARVQAGQLWMADRNFCTTRMLCGVGQARAWFLVRQHASTLHWREAGAFRPCGRIDSGRVWEQPVELWDPDSEQWRRLRRVKLELDQPTRDGERQILLLTNLPAERVSAKQVARVYRQRWTIEQAFEELAVALRGEIDTLGYPKAALFGFCVAVVAYNLVSLVKAALGAVHGRQTVEAEVSGYHLAGEWAAVYPGLVIAVGPRVWARQAGGDPQAFVGRLRTLAQAADLRKYRKAKRGPKNQPPPWSPAKRIKHVATAKLLMQRKTAARAP